MPQMVTTGALAKCAMGVAPAPITFLPVAQTMCGNTPTGNISSMAPFVNIAPFGMCMSPANPAVAAATAAALGVLTPMPCTPVPAGPWIPTFPTIMIKNMPVVGQPSTLICSFGGLINITFPGQVTVQVS